MEQLLVENLKSKWGPVLNCEGMEPIHDNYRQNVTAILLENQEKALKEEANVVNSITPKVHSILLLVSILSSSHSFVDQCLT